MMSSPIVSNASPLIALHQIDQLAILPHLFETILIPTAVVTEIATVSPHPSWLQHQTVTQPIGSQILRASLGAGESETISLALESGCSLVLLDDRPARRLAQTLGLSVIGTLGILLAAKRQGFVPLLMPFLDNLRMNNFRISDSLYEIVLKDAGEEV
jgi:predicted nucleic acid-binding protein